MDEKQQEEWERLVTWAVAELRSTLNSVAGVLAFEGEATGRLGHLRAEAAASVRKVDQQFAQYYRKQAMKRRAS